MARIGREEAADFLYDEALLLDERRFEEWLDLFAEDGVYWLPIDEASGPKRHLSLIHDDALRRQERVYRLLHTRPPSQDPVSRTQHFVSNVRAEDGPDEQAVVRSAQLICEIRRGAGDDRQLGLSGQQNLAARCEHHLLRVDGAWRIKLKKLVLLRRDLPIPNLTFIL